MVTLMCQPQFTHIQTHCLLYINQNNQTSFVFVFFETFILFGRQLKLRCFRVFHAGILLSMEHFHIAILVF